MMGGGMLGGSIGGFGLAGGLIGLLLNIAIIVGIVLLIVWAVKQFNRSTGTSLGPRDFGCSLCQRRVDPQRVPDKTQRCFIGRRDE
jgi:predicted lipid-binding transport protein (Tim44 family)